MKKFGIFALVISIMTVMVCGAFAEEAVPSINIATIIKPAVTVDNTESTDAEVETIAVYVAPVVENKVEHKLFEDIVKTVEETSIHEYFGIEVMKEAVAFIPVDVLPEGIVDIESIAAVEEIEALEIQIDEFFALGEEGYEIEYGDLDVTFQFATEYEDDDVLVAMIGILPEGCKIDYEEDEELEEGLEIEWIPVETIVVEGCVQVKLPADILDIVSERNVVFTLLKIGGEQN